MIKKAKEIIKADEIYHDSNNLNHHWRLIRSYDYKLMGLPCTSLTMIPYYQRKLSQKYHYIIGHAVDHTGIYYV